MSEQKPSNPTGNPNNPDNGFFKNPRRVALVVGAVAVAIAVPVIAIIIKRKEEEEENPLVKGQKAFDKVVGWAKDDKVASVPDFVRTQSL